MMNDLNRIPKYANKFHQFKKKYSLISFFSSVCFYTFTAIIVDSQMKFKNPKSVEHRLAITRPEIVVPAF